jgi:hypothetical protein
MIEIKKIDDSDLGILQELHYLMCVELGYTNRYSCLASLLQELTFKDSIVLGLYKDNVLVGFTLGYGKRDVFYFSAIYIVKEYRYYALRLLVASEWAIPSSYTHWEAESILPSSQKLLEKFGACQNKIIYRKGI